MDRIEMRVNPDQGRLDGIQVEKEWAGVGAACQAETLEEHSMRAGFASCGFEEVAIDDKSNSLRRSQLEEACYSDEELDNAGFRSEDSTTQPVECMELVRPTPKSCGSVFRLACQDRNRERPPWLARGAFPQSEWIPIPKLSFNFAGPAAVQDSGCVDPELTCELCVGSNEQYAAKCEWWVCGRQLCSAHLEECPMVGCTSEFSSLQISCNTWSCHGWDSLSQCKEEHLQAEHGTRIAQDPICQICETTVSTPDLQYLQRMGM